MGNRLLKKMHRWLASAAKSGDLTFLLTEEVTLVLEALDGRVDDLRADLALARAAGWLHWLRYTVLPEGEDEEDLMSALAWFEPLAEVSPHLVPEPLVDIYRSYRTEGEDGREELDDSGDLLERALASNDPVELDRAIGYIRTIVARLPAGDPDLPGDQMNLGVALQVRFERGGELADIDEAIELNEQVLAEVADDDPDLVMYLTNLGAAYSTRFARTEAPADLDNSVQALERAAAVSPPGHPELATCLNNLSAAYVSRFRLRGTPGDLAEAVRHAERAVALSPDRRGQNYAERLQNLALARRARFDLTDSRTDLDEAIRAADQAVAALPARHPQLGRYLSYLANGLLQRFKRTGTVADGDRAVELMQTAIAATQDDSRADLLADLGQALCDRYLRTLRLEDLDGAVRAYELGLAAMPPGHSARPRGPVQSWDRTADAFRANRLPGRAGRGGERR